MGEPVGTDPGRGEWQSARRAVARRHHPDVGGDVEVYLAALAEVDTRFGRGTARAVVPIVVRHSRLRRARRTLRSVAAAVRRTRYTEL